MPPRARELLAVSAAVTACSLFLWGNGLFGFVPYLAAIHRLADPALYPGDPDVAAMLALPVWSLWPFAWCDRAGLLDPALLLATVLSRAALAAGAVWLAEALPLGRGARLLSAGLIVAAAPGWGVLGSYELIGAEPSQSYLALPFCLFALAEVVRGRPLLAGVVAGLGANLHTATVGTALPSLLALAAALPGGDPTGPRWRTPARLLAGFLLAAAPTLLWIGAAALGDLGAVGRAEAYRVARLTIGEHLFLARCAAPERQAFLASLLVIAVGWRRDLARLALALGGAALAVLALDALLVEPELAPLLLLKAHLLRASLWTSLLARLLLGAAAARELEERHPAGLLGALLAAVGCVLAPPLVGVGLPLLAWARWRRGELPRFLALGAGLGALAASLADLSGALAGPLLKAALLVAVALAAGRLGARWPAGRALAERHPGPLLAGAALLALLLLRGEVVLRGGRLVGAGVDLPRLSSAPERLHDPRTVALARWAARETPLDSKFLAPPAELAFFAYARRSVVARVDVGTFAIWDLAGSRERLQRLEDVGWRWGTVGAEAWTYATWPQERVAAVAQRYGARFVVIDRALRPEPLPWRLAWENERWRVYDRGA